MNNVLNIDKCKICGGLVRIENNEYGTSKLCTCVDIFIIKKT